MRIVRQIARVLLSLLLIFALLVGYLFWTTPGPRETQGWDRLDDLDAGRGEAASAVAEGRRLYVIGGLQGAFASASDRVDVYDATTGTWSRAPSLPEARHHPAAAALGGTIYVTGGSKKATDWSPETNAWRLLPGADAWEPIQPLPEGRMGHQMVGFDGRLFAVGGRGGADVLVYDPDGGWTRGAPIPQPRDHLAVVESGGRLFAIGGRDDEIRARVDAYDVLADRWTEEPPDLPIPMSAMAAGVLADGIHVVGGEDPQTVGGGVIEAHWVLGDDDWVEAPLPIVATHGSAFGVIDGSLVIAGGARRQGAWSVLGWTGITQWFAG